MCGQSAPLTLSPPNDGGTGNATDSLNHGDGRPNEAASGGEGDKKEKIERLLGLIEREMKVGVVHLFGETEVVAKKGSDIGNRFLIDNAYHILRKNLRQREEVFQIPHQRLLKVGMTYEL
ncbi:hypothetical protein ACLOJK_017946 [Asimina triloba]